MDTNVVAAVVCRPGERFYGESDAAEARQCMRFAFTAVPRENLERVIAILGSAASANSTQKGAWIALREPEFGAPPAP